MHIEEEGGKWGDIKCKEKWSWVEARGESLSLLVKSYNGFDPAMRDMQNLFGGNRGQAVQMCAFLFLQSQAHQRVVSDLFLKFLQNILPLLLLSGVLAGECVEEVFPAIDGHAQPEGDVALESVLHAEERVLVGGAVLVNYLNFSRVGARFRLQRRDSLP